MLKLTRIFLSVQDRQLVIALTLLITITCNTIPYVCPANNNEIGGSFRSINLSTKENSFNAAVTVDDNKSRCENDENVPMRDYFGSLLTSFPDNFNLSETCGNNLIGCSSTGDNTIETLENGKDNSNDNRNRSNDNNASRCKVYFAPSTIPGAGMGIFSGRDFQSGDEVLSPDAIVPLIDIEWQNGGVNYESLWAEYVWTGRTFPGMDEPGVIVQGASFGVGAIPNCIFPLINLEESWSIRDNANIQPGVDPGTGAFTVFHGRSGLATRSIHAGEELLVSYGEGYFKTRSKLYGPVPTEKDYNKVDVVLKKFRQVDQNLRHQISQQTYDSRPASIDSFSDAFYDLLGDFVSVWSKKMYKALPNNITDVHRALDELGTSKMLQRDQIIRSIDWLDENGSCMDHLVVRNSQIPHAGRGAFANKYIRRGEVVAPVPLIHYPNRSILNMYTGYVDDEGYYRRNASDMVHQQLILNYCFGHRDSSLLLCPYGVVSSLINHGSTKNQDANVKIVWSNKSMSKPEWLDLPLNKWALGFRAGLAFDYIALRDIMEGEEVLVDYGDEWEQAWNEHVQNWTPKKQPSQLLNEKDPPLDIPHYASWPWHDVDLWCFDIFIEIHGFPSTSEDLVAHPCRVVATSFAPSHVSSMNEEKVYTVEILSRFHDLPEDYVEYDDDDTEYCVEYLEGIIFNLPRQALVFGNFLEWEDDKRFYRHSWSFRHDMRIPDSIMPELWKNNRVNERAHESRNKQIVD